MRHLLAALHTYVPTQIFIFANCPTTSLAMGSEKKQDLGHVLVVGGCGFLGHHIVKQIASSYTSTISVLDYRTTHNRQPNVTYYDADITSTSSLSSVFEKAKPDVIIHTASPTSGELGTSAAAIRAKKEMFYKVNVEGTKNLLDCSAKVGTVKAFVYTSSASVVHDHKSNLINADERYPVLNATQPEYYSKTKGMAEEAVLAYNRHSESPRMLTCAIRPALIFGEGDAQLTPNLLKAYEKGQTRFQLGANDNLFDFTYVGNVVHGHLLAVLALLQTSKLNVELLNHEKVDGEAFFITNSSPVYFWDFTRMVWAIAGDKTEPGQVWVINRDMGLVIATVMEWVYWAVTFGGVPNLTRYKVEFSCMTRYFSIEKAAKRLGYLPIYDLEESVQKTVDWFLEKKGDPMVKKTQ